MTNDSKSDIIASKTYQQMLVEFVVIKDEFVRCRAIVAEQRVHQHLGVTQTKEAVGFSGEYCKIAHHLIVDRVSVTQDAL